MSTWREVMKAAEAAKVIMLSDRAAGEKEFELLLQHHPKDGMVFFKRGEAYEALVENTRAADDFRHALALFPIADWKHRAKDALARVGRPSAG